MSQIERLQQLRQNRNNEEVTTLLSKLTDCAKTGEGNLAIIIGFDANTSQNRGRRARGNAAGGPIHGIGEYVALYPKLHDQLSSVEIELSASTLSKNLPGSHCGYKSLGRAR